MLTVQKIIDREPGHPAGQQLPAPAHAFREGSRIMLTAPSMARHMSDENWQQSLGLQAGGYTLHGHSLGLGTNVKEVLDKVNPAVVFVLDQHEWDIGHLAVREERFHGIEALATRQDIFKVTQVKDSHRQYHSARHYAKNMGCHAIVTPYHPRIVCHMSNWIRPQHVIRTWHTVDPQAVPPFSTDRRPCLLSGSLGGAYPLRNRIHAANLPIVTCMKHPGYKNDGCQTPAYLRTLSQFKVAICTSSKYGYALRKLIEGVACGCVVVTDLPREEVLPEIDEGLVRVSPDIHLSDLRLQLQDLCDKWDAEKQQHLADNAKKWYDFREVGKRLANDIEVMRNTWSC